MFLPFGSKFSIYLSTLFCFLFSSFLTFGGCFTSNNGSATGSVTSMYSVVGAEYGYQYEATIYTSAEIGVFGTITSIGLYTTDTGVLSVAIPVKIYMRENALTDQLATDWISKIAGATLVYSGTITLNTLGWNYVTLDTPFPYLSGNFEIMTESSYGGSGAGLSAPSNWYFNPSGPKQKKHQYWRDNVIPIGSGTVSDSKSIVRLGFADNLIWTGTTSSDWETGSNWSSGTAPCFCDNVILAASGSDPIISIADEAICADLTISGGVVFEIGNTQAGGGSFEIYGNVNNEGSIYHTSDLNTSLYGSSCTFGGAGDFAHLNEFGSFHVSKNANYTLSSSITALHQLRIDGIFNLSTYSCPIYTLSFDAGVVNLNSGVLEVANSIDYVSGTLNLNTGTVYFNSGDDVWVALGYPATDQTVNSFNYYNLKVRSNNGFTATIGDGSSINVSHDLTLENPGTSGGAIVTANDLLVSGDVYVANTGNSLSLDLANRIYRPSGTGSLNMGNLAGNTINITYSSAANTAFSGFDPMVFYGKVTYNSSSTQLVMGGNYDNLTIANTGVRNLNSAVVVNGDITLGGGVFDLVSSNLDLKGNWSNTGSSFVPNSNRVTLNGTAQQSITRTSSAATVVSEDFGSGLPSGWSLSNDGAHATEGVEWRASASQCGTLTLGSTTGGTGFLVVDSDCDGISGMSLGTSTIETATYDFSDYTDITVGFEHFYDDYASSAIDLAQIDYRLNGGAWVNISTWSGSDQGTAGVPNVFSQAEPLLDNESSVQFRFVYSSGWDLSWRIDDFSVTGVNPVEVFDNVTADNSAGILLGSSVQINTDFTFTNGDITTTTANYLEFDEDAVATGSSAGSHVVGPVKKLTNSTTQFSFPTGDGSNYKPCSVTPSSSSATTWSAEYFPIGHSNYSTVTGAGIDHVSPGFYWDISRKLGSANATVMLNWNSASGVDVPADLIVSHYNGTAWEKIGTTPTISGNASAGSVEADVPSTSFSPFTLGSGSGNNSLPISLVSFETICSINEVLIEFSVLNQVDNDYFMIERSEDAIDWEELGILDGAGTINSQLDYNFVDVNPLDGLSYYRLSQVDHNGLTKTFSPAVTQCGANSSSGLSVGVYPNPVDSEFTFDIELEEYQGDNVYYTIMDLRGSIVASEKINLNRGYHKQTIDVNGLSNGVYILRFNNTRNYIAETRVVKR